MKEREGELGELPRKIINLDFRSALFSLFSLQWFLFSQKKGSDSLVFSSYFIHSYFTLLNGKLFKTFELKACKNPKLLWRHLNLKRSPETFLWFVRLFSVQSRLILNETSWEKIYSALNCYQHRPIKARCFTSTLCEA